MDSIGWIVAVFIAVLWIVSLLIRDSGRLSADKTHPPATGNQQNVYAKSNSEYVNSYEHVPEYTKSGRKRKAIYPRYTAIRYTNKKGRVRYRVVDIYGYNVSMHNSRGSAERRAEDLDNEEYPIVRKSDGRYDIQNMSDKIPKHTKSVPKDLFDDWYQFE